MAGPADVLRLLRPHIVLGGLLGYALGFLRGVNEGGAFDAARFLAVCAVVLLGDASTHFGNSLYDAEGDAGAPVKPFSVPNILSTRVDLRGAAGFLMWACAGASVLAACLAVMFLGTAPWIFALAVAGNALGLAYSHPCARLVRRGLGEAAIGASTGFIVVAAGYLASGGSPSAGLAFYTAPLVLLGFGLALSLEVPDFEADAATGKRNLVVRLGRGRAVALIALASLGAAALTGWSLLRDGGAAESLLAFASTLAPLLVVLSTSSTDRESSTRLQGRYFAALFLVLVGLLAREILTLVG